jgi:hypothetical protein
MRGGLQTFTKVLRAAPLPGSYTGVIGYLWKSFRSMASPMALWPASLGWR